MLDNKIIPSSRNHFYYGFLSVLLKEAKCYYPCSIDAEVSIVTDAVICLLPLSWKCLHWGRGRKWKWKYSGGICLACTVQLFMMQIMSQLKQLPNHDSFIHNAGVTTGTVVTSKRICTVFVLTVVGIIFGSGPNCKNSCIPWSLLFFFFLSDCDTHRTLLQLQWTGKWGFINLLCFKKWIYMSKENFLLDRQRQWEALFCLLFSKWMGICHSLL